MREGSYRYLEQERVIYGRPAALAVAQEADRLAAKHIFVATGRTLNRATPIVSELTAPLGPALAGVFDECIEHTPRNTVVALAGELRETGADLVVAIGGGTVIDTVKMALLCLAQDVRDADALDRWHVRLAPDGSREVPEIGSPPIRQIAVPTTLSGAEFSDLAGCSDTRRDVKQAFTMPKMAPLSVILDPEVTVHAGAALALDRNTGGGPRRGVRVLH
jgi:alcohol dehydrogenase class IV